MKKIMFCISLFVFTATSQAAEDRLEIEGSSITGIREAPKAMYIVPWRPLMPVEMKGVEVKSLLEEELAIIDRSAFQRRIELFDVMGAGAPQ